MLPSPRHLLDRLFYGRSRADELASLRARFATQPGRRGASAAQIQLAEQLRSLRLELSQACVSTVCGGCAKGHPLPAGQFEGGHCCSGQTLELFSQDEVAALKLAGTTTNRMRPPRQTHAGCIFRGARGCSLLAVDRPSLCVRYCCIDLRQQLRDEDQWASYAALAKALRDTFDRFVESRQAARGVT